MEQPGLALDTVHEARAEMSRKPGGMGAWVVIDGVGEPEEC